MTQQIELFQLDPEPVFDTLSHEDDHDFGWNPENTDKFWSLFKQWLDSHPDWLKDVPNSRQGKFWVWSETKETTAKHGGSTRFEAARSWVWVEASDSGIRIRYYGRWKPIQKRIECIKQGYWSSKHDCCINPESPLNTQQTIDQIFEQIHEWLIKGMP